MWPFFDTADVCWIYGSFSHGCWHPTMDCWAQRAKVCCAAGETLHRNECKHMTGMCCIEWCSFQGPARPTQFWHCQLEIAEPFEIFLCGRSLIPPTFAGSMAPSLMATGTRRWIVGRNEQKCVARQVKLCAEMSVRAHIYIYMSLVSLN